LDISPIHYDAFFRKTLETSNKRVLLEFSAGLTKCNQRSIGKTRTPRDTQVANSNAALTHGYYRLICY